MTLNHYCKNLGCLIHDVAENVFDCVVHSTRTYRSTYYVPKVNYRCEIQLLINDLRKKIQVTTAKIKPQTDFISKVDRFTRNGNSSEHCRSNRKVHGDSQLVNVRWLAVIK